MFLKSTNSRAVMPELQIISYKEIKKLPTEKLKPAGQEKLQYPLGVHLRH